MPLQSQLEPGFRCVPISPAEASASVRMCVVIRETSDPASGHFVLLRQMQDARVLLGALADASEKIHEWVELWVQDVENNSTNAARDQQWKCLAETLEESEPESHFSLSAEDRLPVFIVPGKWICRVPTSPDGETISLCTDDKTLLSAGLPAYSGSAARFGKTPSGKFFALNAAAIAFQGAQALPATDATISLNPSAGMLLSRKYAPFGIDEYADILGGRAWNGLTNSKKVIRLNGVYREFGDETSIRTKGRHFLGTRRDLPGRIAETLYLKMTLVRQCLRRLMEDTRRTSLPLLNVDASTFRVRLGAGESELPFCWSAQVSLARPGESAELDVPGSRSKHFTSRAPATVSVFRPEQLGLARKGRGNVRIRRVFTAAEGGFVSEGTLVTPERIPAGTNELLRLDLPFDGDKTFSLIGTVDPAMALAPGETGFRTIPMNLDQKMEQVLRSYEGTPFHQIPYEVIPPLSSPCDLYAMGVLALRILFSGGSVTLPVALDTMLSLGRALAAIPEVNEHQLHEVVAAVIESDPRWLESLGTHHLLKDAPQNPLPLEIWSRVLALIVRFFPGIGAFSYCSDLAAAPTEAPHAIYSKPLDHLDLLLVRLRCLALSSWSENNEMASLLAGYLK